METESIEIEEAAERLKKPSKIFLQNVRDSLEREHLTREMFQKKMEERLGEETLSYHTIKKHLDPSKESNVTLESAQKYALTLGIPIAQLLNPKNKNITSLTPPL